jgi:hypothetical protein
MMPTDPAMLGYIAGIFDGEGSISILRRKSCSSWNWSHSEMLIVSNTNEELIAWFLRNIGGVIDTIRRSNARHKTSYSWRINGRNVERFLVPILPYLVVKKARAEIALEFRRLCPRNAKPCKRLDIALLTRREELRQQMQFLNRKGPVETSLTGT